MSPAIAVELLRRVRVALVQLSSRTCPDALLPSVELSNSADPPMPLMLIDGVVTAPLAVTLSCAAPLRLTAAPELVLMREPLPMTLTTAVSGMLTPKKPADHNPALVMLTVEPAASLKLDCPPTASLSVPPLIATSPLAK